MFNRRGYHEESSRPRVMLTPVQLVQELIAEIEGNLYLPPKFRKLRKDHWEQSAKPEYLAYLQDELKRLQEKASRVAKVEA